MQELERRLGAAPEDKENKRSEVGDSEEVARLQKLNGLLLGEIATYKRQLVALECQTLDQL